MELTIHALSHSYGDKKALTGFTHTFVPGITALLGPNGAGKSTLIHLICDLLPRQTGTIAFDGTDILSMGPAFRQVLGFMPQSQGMYDDMTAWEFLLYMAQLKGLRPRAAREQLRELLQVVNLWDAAHRRVGGFSGGMRQRVMLAQALLGAPKVLLLDEPLGALDLRLRKDMQNELKRIQQQMGITFIYVTHDQEEALTMSDTVVVMDKGRIQQIGTPEDIYNEPKNAFVADFIGESNILNGTMVRDNVVKMYGKEFPCVDGGFAPNEPVDVVIRPEDIDIVPVEQGQLAGTVTNVTFKGMQYDIIVDFRGFKWLIQTTDHSPVGARIGVKIDPDGFHIMKKSEYSGQFGDYSSYSEEYEELADASLETDEEEIGDEE